MKRIITLMSFCLFAGMVLGQGPALKVDANGNVGVGTATPTTSLHVKKVQDNGVVSLRVENNELGASKHSVFAMATANGGGNARMQWVSPGRGTWYMGLDNADGGRMKFVWNDANLSNNQRFVIKTSGDVGIGTATPDAKLSVNGDASKDGGGEWSTFSDRRLKNHINEFSYGLKEVLQFNPVTFQYTGELGLGTEKEYVGVIAQEVQKIAPFMVFDAISNDQVEGTEDQFKKNKIGYLKYDGSALKYMLVNAMKEQQHMIENLQNENDELKAQIEDIYALLKGREGANLDEVNLSNDGFAKLEQNTPNPFNGQTSLNYFIPEGFSKASISIFSNSGQLLKEVAVTNGGKGEIKVNSNDLPSGNYYYTLIVDGAKVDTKKMVLID